MFTLSLKTRNDTIVPICPIPKEAVFSLPVSFFNSNFRSNSVTSSCSESVLKTTQIFETFKLTVATETQAYERAWVDGKKAPHSSAGTTRDQNLTCVLQRICLQEPEFCTMLAETHSSSRKVWLIPIKLESYWRDRGGEGMERKVLRTSFYPSYYSPYTPEKPSMCNKRKTFIWESNPIISLVL